LIKDEKGNLLVPHSGEVCEQVTEQNYVFDITPELFAEVAKWHNETSVHGHRRVIPESIYNLVSAELKVHKNTISVSRPTSRLQWGIRVPDDH